MTRLLLVRHGETDWNRQNRHQGQKNIPLNARGQQQVAAVAKRLAGERVDAIYASDLVRAWKTATAIAAHHDGFTSIKDRRLREMHFGDWEGLTWAEIIERTPAAVDNWSRFILETGPPGGENLPGFATRIRDVINEIINTYPDNTVLLVAHGGSLMVLICLLLDHPVEKYWQFRIEKASLSEIEISDGAAIINYLNDTNHLKNVTDESNA